jgi:hypothetical protein
LLLAVDRNHRVTQYETASVFIRVCTSKLYHPKMGEERKSVEHQGKSPFVCCRAVSRTRSNRIQHPAHSHLIPVPYVTTSTTSRFPGSGKKYRSVGTQKAAFLGLGCAPQRLPSQVLVRKVTQGYSVGSLELLSIY